MAYSAITVEGGLVPSDLLERLAVGEGQGQSAKDFGLDGRRLTDEIQAAFSDVSTAWANYQSRLGYATDSAETITRRDWMLPVFERLGWGRLQYRQAALEAGGDRFVVSHPATFGDRLVPVDIIGHDRDLGKRYPGDRRSAYASVQEYLNRSDALWGLVTNGQQIWLLRDSNRVARPTYVEFDLAAMVRDNLFNEFSVLYRLLHRSRFPSEAVPEEKCLLETCYQQGLDEGGRVREHLRDGVEEALKELGSAFLSPRNLDLREALSSGRLTPLDYYRELLRLVYRLLFLLVVEERKLLFAPIDVGELEGSSGGSDQISTVLQAQATYSRYYSMSALRSRSERPLDASAGADRFTDAWDGIKRLFQVLSGESEWVASALGLSPLDGELFGVDACRDLETAACANGPFLRAIRHLTTFRDDSGIRRRVNFAGLDVEELGSVYESLLDFHPYVDFDASTPFQLVTGAERKTTGSYYTPSSLVHELIASALVPVLAERLKDVSDHVPATLGIADIPFATTQAKEEAILSMKVCDPACGSGAFLLAASRRLARELAKVRSEEDEPSPQIYRQALREVIRRCIYGVDKNALAVDLCKVALWIEGYNSGLPLSFLDNHIRCGDSLVGVFDLKVLVDGIPDGAFTALTGDDKAVAAAYRNRNRQERSGQLSLLDDNIDPADVVTTAAPRFQGLAISEEPVAYVTRDKAAEFARLQAVPEYVALRQACDLWTAAFFAPLRKPDDGNERVVTTGAVRRALANVRGTTGAGPGVVVRANASALAGTHPFFHWPLEFPDAYSAETSSEGSGLGKAGTVGFDVILGNPPWERIKLQEKEFFAARDPEITRAPNKAARDRLIGSLPHRHPELAREFDDARRAAESASVFVRTSGRFPLCGRGDINTYSIFAELNRGLLRPTGYAGCIVPTGIATDDTTKDFFGDLVEQRSLASVLGFYDRGKIFTGADVHAFCLLTVTGPGLHEPKPEFVFFAKRPEDLRDPDRRFTLTADDIALVNPNTKTCPIFRTRRDAQITKGIYERVPVLIDEAKGEDGNPWGIRFLAMFHMSNDSHLFRTRSQLEREEYRLEENVFQLRGQTYLPLYEAKMLHQFDHRWATYRFDGDVRDITDTEKQSPHQLPLPRYWVASAEVTSRLDTRWPRQWLLGFRNVCRATDERTTISAFLPAYAVGHSMPLILSSQDPIHIACLQACLASYVSDYVARQKVAGINLTFGYLSQFAIPHPSAFDSEAPWTDRELLSHWIASRVLELSFTASDLRPLAHDLGWTGPPFSWNPSRRFVLRRELDAAFFYLYGLEDDEINHVMDTFPVIRERETRLIGSYRTKETIFHVRAALREATQSGQAYRTISESLDFQDALTRKTLIG